MKNKKLSKLHFENLPTTYSGWLSLHMLRPVHDDIEHNNALEILEALAGHQLNPEQEDYFDALSTLVEGWERQQIDSPKVTGQELLQHLIEANEMTAADLARLLECDRSLGVRLLNGERQLTIPHIKKLSVHFGLPPQVFLEAA